MKCLLFLLWVALFCLASACNNSDDTNDCSDEIADYVETLATELDEAYEETPPTNQSDCGWCGSTCAMTYIKEQAICYKYPYDQCFNDIYNSLVSCVNDCG